MKLDTSKCRTLFNRAVSALLTPAIKNITPQKMPKGHDGFWLLTFENGITWPVSELTLAGLIRDTTSYAAGVLNDPSLAYDPLTGATGSKALSAPIPSATQRRTAPRRSGTQAEHHA